MNQPITVAVIILAWTTLSPLLYGEGAGKAEGSKRPPTHAELAKRMAKRTNPIATNRDVHLLEGASLEKKEERKKRESLIGRSTILSYGGNWTVVPKGSILHVPPAYQDRLSGKPTGRLLPWKEFYQRNRGWIFTQSVDMANARGESVLADDVLNNRQQLGRVVVAVFHHGPISVKAPKSASKQPILPNSSPLPR